MGSPVPIPQKLKDYCAALTKIAPTHGLSTPDELVDLASLFSCVFFKTSKVSVAGIDFDPIPEALLHRISPIDATKWEPNPRAIVFPVVVDGTEHFVGFQFD
jgi:hypothetical protein